MEKLLEGHFEATTNRMQNYPVVLAVQDTTSLNYTAHPMTEGLGPINTKGDTAIGLELHDTLAFTPEGTPFTFTSSPLRSTPFCTWWSVPNTSSVSPANTSAGDVSVISTS